MAISGRLCAARNQAAGQHGRTCETAHASCQPRPPRTRTTGSGDGSVVPPTRALDVSATPRFLARFGANLRGVTLASMSVGNRLTAYRMSRCAD